MCICIHMHALVELIIGSDRHDNVCVQHASSCMSQPIISVRPVCMHRYICMLYVCISIKT